MWRAVNPDGGLAYSFMESLAAMYPYYWARAVSGIIYLAGVLVFIWNLTQTARRGELVAARPAETA
jgi:cytochrome c oxidase cbb3-type subunit 1